MSNHLSDAALARYFEGSLDADALLETDDHITACAACRERGEAFASGAAAASLRQALAAPDIEEHPEPMVLASFVDGALETVERENIESHVLACVSCAEDVGDLRQARATLAQAESRASVRVPWFRRASLMVGLASAATIALAIVPLWRWLATEPRGGTQIETASRIPPAPPSSPVDQDWKASLRDGPFTVGIDASGSLAGLPDIPSVDRALLTTALAEGRVRMDGIDDLAGRQGRLLGNRQPSGSLELLTPVATVVESAQPVFRWTAVPGATGYVVSVFDDRFEEVARSGDIAVRAWAPPSPLKRGGVYLWQVTANTPEGPVHAPVPPAPEVKFRVLDAAGLARLSEIRSSAKGSHLVLGVVYAQSGLREAAEQEFRALRDANPDSATAGALLASIQRRPGS